MPVRSAIPKPIATRDTRSHSPVATANCLPPPGCSSSTTIQTQRRAGLDDRIAAARETADRPFAHRQQLQEARTAVEKVRARLTERYSEFDEVPTEVPAAAEPAPARSAAGSAAAPPASPLARTPAGRIGEAPPDVRRPQPPGRGFGR